jgi:hypothetical protein
MIRKTLLQLLRFLISQETKYYAHYLGKVVDREDPDGLGRVKVTVPMLGREEEAAMWASFRHTEAMKVPAKGSLVEVYFLNGDKNLPCVSGVASEMETMLPAAFTGPEKHVIFNDAEGKIEVTWDEKDDELKIGKKDFRECARKDDETESDNTVDSAFWLALINHTHSGVTTGSGATGPAVGVPTSLKTKITTGSSQVKVGDK